MDFLTFFLAGVIFGLLLSHIFPPVKYEQGKVKFKGKAMNNENTMLKKKGFLKRLFKK